MTKASKEILGATVLVFIAALFYLSFSGLGDNKDESQFVEISEKKEEAETEIRTENLARVKQNVVTLDFPADLPIEGNVVAEESYRHIPQGAGRQSTLSYTSALSLEENFQNFKSFAEENAYQIINEEDEEGLKFFYGSNGENDLSVLIRETGGKVLINISYLNKSI